LVLLMSASAFLIAGAGCATGPTPRDRLLKRAAFDLHCTKDEMSVTKLDEKTRGVRGCGRQATYVEMCDAAPTSMLRTCSWVMDSGGVASDAE
jgi:hypothetical protein